MSQRDGFGGGFLLGVIVGGVAGGLLGAIVAGDRSGESATTRLGKKAEGKSLRTRTRELKAEEGIEIARRSLEDKIAQLNATIDDVRQQLGSVNGSVSNSELD